MKKYILVLLSVLFILALSGCKTAHGKSEPEETKKPFVVAPEEDFEYTVSGNKVAIKKYIGTETDVVIPARIEGLQIGRIAVDFLKDSEVREITFPSYFKDFTGITECDTVEIIHLPMSVENITEPFRFCKNLKEIDIEEGGAYKTEEGVLYTADGKTLAAFPCGIAGSFTVPVGVEEIGKFAFSNSSLSEVILPDSLRTIADYSFLDADALEKIAVPSSVRSIGYAAFSGSGIKTAELSEGLAEIGGGAFEKTNITELYIPDSVTKCGAHIADKGVAVSASFPTEAFELLCLGTDVIFRDETMLEEAIRIAEKELLNNVNEILSSKGVVFTDLTGDGFPEAVQLIEDNRLYFYCYDEDTKSWKTDWSMYRYGYYYAGDILVYHLCYDSENDTYLCYSDVRSYYPYVHWYEMNAAEPISVQYCVYFGENGVELYELCDDEIKEPDGNEIIKTLNVSEMLSEYDFDLNDNYKKFVIFTDRFSEEPNGKLLEKNLTANGAAFEEYPYCQSFYPEEMKITVSGADILRGEGLEGVYFKDNALVFDNAVIDASGEYNIVKTSGMDKLTIKLIGDSRIVSDAPCSLISAVRIPLVIEGNGSLEAPKIEADDITFAEGAKISVNEQLVSEKGVMGIITSYAITGKYGVLADKLTIREEASLECRNIRVHTLWLHESARAELTKAAVDMINLYGDSRMNVANYSGGSVISYVEHITVSDNARLYADGTESDYDPIYFDSPHYTVRVFGSGIIEVDGNPNNIKLSLGNAETGILNVKDNGKVIINGETAFNCIDGNSEYISKRKSKQKRAKPIASGEEKTAESSVGL